MTPTQGVTPVVRATKNVTPVATTHFGVEVATTVAKRAATPHATPVATPVEYRPAAILGATRASMSPALLTMPAPQSTSLVAHMPRLARQTTRPLGVPHSPSLPPPPPRVPAAGTPAPSSRCNSDGQLFWEGLWGGTWGNRNPVYSGCYKLGSCDESWSVSPHPASIPLLCPCA